MLRCVSTRLLYNFMYKVAVVGKVKGFGRDSYDTKIFELNGERYLNIQWLLLNIGRPCA